jgi:multimeric flavodoxin WrbA
VIEMAKKILFINGSPRPKGLTAHLLDVFIKKVQQLNQERTKDGAGQVEIDKIDLSAFSIQHCTGCDACLRKPHECPLDISDDMGTIKDHLLAADAIIIASPSYFSNVTGYVKDLIDRTRPLKMAKYLLKNKFFAPVVTSGLRAGGLNAVQDSLIQYALIQGMIVVGALGHPVLMANFPTESAQITELKMFRKPEEISPLAAANSEALAERLWDLLAQH